MTHPYEHAAVPKQHPKARSLVYRVRVWTVRPAYRRSAAHGSGPYSPECVERLSDKSEWAPERDPKGGSEGPNTRPIALPRHRNAGPEHPTAIYQTVSEGLFCEVELPLNGVLGSWHSP